MDGRSSFSLVVFILGMLSIPVFSNVQIIGGTNNQTENKESSSAGDIIRGGAYTSPYSDLQIQLPAGWSGLRLLGVAMISPEGLEAWKHPISMEAAMIIVELDGREMLELAGAAVQESFSQILSENNLVIGHCEQQDYSYVILNGMEALQGISECTSDNGVYSKTKTYAIMAGQRVAVMAFTANSSQSYTMYESVFDESVSTARVSNAVSFKDAIAEALDLTTENYSVVARGNSVEVKVQCNSNISNFSFNEEAKQISFDVEGTNGTNGFSIINAEKVLEPPYTVNMDGQPAPNFFIFEDRIAGENTVQINFQHSPHEIAITGSNVVPEFPLQIVGPIAGVMGIVTIVAWNIRLKESAAF